MSAMPSAAPSSRVSRRSLPTRRPPAAAGTADMIEAVIGDMHNAMPLTRGTIDTRTYA